MFKCPPIKKAMLIASLTLGAFTSSSAFAVTEFVAENTYQKGDTVTYNALTYIAKWNNTGKAPGQTNAWTEVVKDNWHAGVSYTKGTQLTHRGYLCCKVEQHR